MSVQAAIEAELPYLRAEAEALMQDTFAAFAPGAPTTVNGMKKPGWVPQGPTPGKTQSPSSQGRDAGTRRVTIGGGQFDVLESGLHIPLSQFIDTNGRLLLRIGWEFQNTAIGDTTDPAQLGRRWHVVAVPTKSRPTARRLDVAEVPALDLT